MQIRDADIPIITAIGHHCNRPSLQSPITAIEGHAVRHDRARFGTGGRHGAEILRRRAARVSHGMP